MIPSFAPEFKILLEKSFDEIEKAGGNKLRQAIEIIRNRKVFVDPGYDGVFGIVKVFASKKREIKPIIDETKIDKKQPTLF